MEARRIWDIPVVDDDGRLLGLLHLHPAIKALLGV
jgi:arabinose-5-phosphate isomerase